MNNSLQTPNDDYVLTFSDIIKIIKDNKRKILFGSLLLASIAFLYGLTKPVQYMAEATFREKAKSQAGMHDSILSSLIGTTSDSDAETLMKSRKLMEEVVKKINAQAVITKVEISFPFFDWKKMKNNLLTEYALIKGSIVPLHQEINSDITASDILYNGETPFGFRVEINKNHGYTVYDGNHQLLGEGLFNHPFSSDKFILSRR